MSSPNGVAVLAGLGAAAVIGGLSWIFSRGEQKSKIQQELLQFYSREVQIPSHDMKEAKRVVAVIATKLKKKLEEMMWNEHKIECNKWMYTGSSYEGLKVIAPDEFDIMVAFDMRNDTPQPSFLGSLFRLSFKSDSDNIYDFIPGKEGSRFATYVNGKYILHSQAVMKRFHSVLQRAVNSVDFGGMKVWIGQDGPAMKVMAIYHSQYNEEKYLKIDLVPAIANNNRYYVAKPNRYDTTEGAQGKWRASFSEQEKKKIEYAKEDQKVVLRIMKAFCKKDSPLAYIDSYYLKTVFLHMLDEHPESWSDVEKYVKAFLQRLLGYIKQGHLPHYCNQEYNLITHFLDEHITVDNITRRIERLLLMNDDKLIQILQR